MRAFIVTQLLLLLLSACALGTAQKIHATIEYKLSGTQSVVPGWAVGGVVVRELQLSDASGARLGTASTHCHIVAPVGANYKAICTTHLDWADGSTMTAHATEVVGPTAGVIRARRVVAGGIGQWNGAHGEDVAYSYDPSKGSGGGKILLYCLKGVC